MNEFDNVINEICAMFDSKNKDYGSDEDPLANITQSKEWGIRPWVSAMNRGTDKIKRLQKFACDGELANEGVEDSFLDLAVYTIIALTLYRKEQA